MNTKFQHLRATWRHFLGIAAAGLFVVVLAGSFVPEPAVSQSASPITGWAWSDTIGWISMGGAGYGMSMDTSGVVTGYAWSDNIGWVSANDADLKPACTTAAGPGSKVDLTGGQWNGWLRAIAGGSAQSGSWDGCISMSGAGYGVSFEQGTGKFGQTSKFAWEGNTDLGAAVVGWVDFSGVSTEPTSCTPPEPVGVPYCKDPSTSCSYDAACLESCNPCPYGCNSLDGKCNGPPLPTGTFTVKPILIGASNTGAEVIWNVQNVTRCDVVTTPNVGSWGTAADASNTSTGGPYTSILLTQQTIFTIHCPGLDGPTGPAFDETVIVQYAPSYQEF